MGSIRFDSKKHNINELVNTSFDDVGIQAENKNIELIFKNNTDCEYVLCDPDMINTVIRNLLSNSIKFSEKNTIITVSIDNLQNDSINYIMVSVKDQGVGMSPEDQNKLFQIDSNHTTQGTDNELGTGLGLILVHEFIERHKNSI